MKIHRKIHRKRNRRLFSLLLAAMLAAEPAGTVSIVRAAEESAEIVTMMGVDTGTPDRESESGTAVTGKVSEPIQTTFLPHAEDEARGEKDLGNPDSDNLTGNENGNADSEVPGNEDGGEGAEANSGDTKDDENGKPDSGDVDEENGSGVAEGDGENDSGDTGNGAEESGSEDTGGGEGEAIGSEDTGGIEESGSDEENGIEGEEPTDAEEDFEDTEEADAKEDSEDTEEADAEETTEEVEEIEDKIFDSFTEMPSSYRLSSEQMAGKLDLAAHMDEIGEYREGIDYVEGQIITFADTQEEAELIADAYNAQIVEFEFRILTLQLNEEGIVGKAVRAAASENINLPAVWPNFYRYASGEIVEEQIMDFDDLSEEAVEEQIMDSDGQLEEAADSMMEEEFGSEDYEDDFIEIEMDEFVADEDGESAENTDLVDPIDYEDLEMPSDDYLEALGYSDPYLQSSNYYYQYHHTTIGSAYAWSAGATGRNIKVAVLDTGVTNQTEVSATSIFGNGNSDSQGHGTHVAGIIGAKANGIMGVGVAPDVTLYSGNVLPNGTGTDADIMRAIRAAENYHVDIINMSLGGIGYNGSFQIVVNEAYQAGIAIFAAAGNDGGVNYDYPACYNHVISVAATNAGNGRAYFSNYGNKVDLSAPGVAIWSTGRNGGGYVGMSGTSMACPVAVGEAAVILSGNENIRNKSGRARVDALESLMKANTLKVGSGMGSGITILPKALKLSTAAVKPATPVIRLTPDNSSAAQSVRVTIEAPDNVKVYYTTNGQNPSFKNGLLGSGAVRYSQQFTISNQAKATVKAIAVNESGVSSAVRSVTYTLKPYVSSITISGVQQIAQGKSVQLKAEVQPAYAANKKVTWELYTTDNRKIDKKTDAALAKEIGVSISSGGKVTASSKAKLDSYEVRAKSKDALGIIGTYRIMVTDAVKIDSVIFKMTKLSIALPGDKTYDLGACLEGKCKDGMSPTVSDFKWSSSNESVARVSTSGVVTAVKPGKVTITALANDSSGKKATCTVTVTQQVTNITISNNNIVAVGKSQTYKATILPTTASNKKVKWTLLYGSEKGSEEDPDEDLEKGPEEVTAQRAKELGVSINASSGKLTTTSKAQTGFYTVKATASDGSGISGSRVIKVTKGSITGITFTDKAHRKVTLFRKQQVYGTQTSAVVYADIKGTDGADMDAYEVTNSNPGIATVTSRRTNGKITLTINATGMAAGKTTITIRATDGSNKKLTCTVTVRNPVSGIRVAPSGGNTPCVVMGKSLQLRAVTETENGAASSKGVTWELYASDGSRIDADSAKIRGISISSGGRVKAAKNALTGSYTAKAVAKDGSGVTGSCTISVGNPATYIKLYSYYDGYLSTNRKYIRYKGRTESMYISSDISQGTITVSSSNPGVMSASLVSGGIQIIASKKGSATITLKALDGSGKKVKYRFRVK